MAITVEDEVGIENKGTRNNSRGNKDRSLISIAHLLYEVYEVPSSERGVEAVYHHADVHLVVQLAVHVILGAISLLEGHRYFRTP
jgi:hypothetical protein